MLYMYIYICVCIIYYFLKRILCYLYLRSICTCAVIRNFAVEVFFIFETWIYIYALFSFFMSDNRIFDYFCKIFET